MADVKISGLTLGDPAQGSDYIPIDRAGANFRVSAGSIAALSTGELSQLVISDTSFNAVYLGSNPGIEVHQTTGTQASINVFKHGTTGLQPVFVTWRSRGTKDVPLALQSADYFGGYVWGGYDGSAYFGGSYIFAQASENWDATHHGNNLQVNVIDKAGQVNTETFRFGANSGAGSSLSNHSTIDFTVAWGKIIGFANNVNSAADGSISRLNPASLVIGNGSQGDASGLLQARSIGINTAAYVSAQLTIVGDATLGLPVELHSSYANGIDLYTHAAQGFRGPYQEFFKSRGTQSSPAAVQTNDALGGINFGGYDGTAYGVGISIVASAQENWTSSAHGSYLKFYVTPNGSTNVTSPLELHSDLTMIQLLDIGATDLGLSRLGPASLALGNGMQGDYSGTLVGSTVLLGTSVSDGLGFAIEVHGTSFASGGASFISHSNSFPSVAVRTRTSRGTQSAPIGLHAGDYLGFIPFDGYDGTAYATGAQFSIQTGSQWSASNHNASIDVECAQEGNASTTPVFRFGAGTGATPNFYNISLVNLELISSVVLGWTNTVGVNSNIDTGISRLGAASLAIGNGTAGDHSGILSVGSGTQTSPAINISSNVGQTQGFYSIGNNQVSITFGGSGTIGGWTLTGGGTIPTYSHSKAGVIGFAAGNTPGTEVDTAFSRTSAGVIAVGNGTASDTSGALTLKNIFMSDFGSAPTSAGTAGTAGEIVYHSGLLYFCSVTGGVGAATWNKLNMTAV